MAKVRIQWQSLVNTAMKPLFTSDTGGCSPLRIEQQEHEYDQSPLPSSQVKNMWSAASTLRLSPQREVYLLGYRLLKHSLFKSLFTAITVFNYIFIYFSFGRNILYNTHVFF